jgi:hypothetical protein
MSHHILTNQTEPWATIKSLAQNKSIYMDLSLLLSFYLKHSLGSYTVATTVGFPVKIIKGLAPQSPATRSMEDSEATVGVKYPRYHGLSVTAQYSTYDRFPLVANGSGTIHPIPDKASPH